MSLPVIITNLLRTAYNLADMIWLGRLSKGALAAITFAYPIVFLFIALGMGVAVAGSVLVAQYEGAGKREDVEYAASQTLFFSLAVAVGLGVIGFFLVQPVLNLLGASPDVIPLATQYLRVVTLGLFSMFGFSVFIALMRGFGETVTPMLVMLLSVALNIIIDPFLIFGWSFFPKLGTQGAAIATVSCRGLGLIVGLWILFTGRKGLKVHLQHMKPDFQFFKQIFRIGVPASVEGAGRALSVNALLSVVGGFSTSVVAGYGIGIRIFSTVFLPAMAVSRSVETMTGQNIGAGRFDRAQQANYLSSLGMLVFMSLLGVGVFFSAPELVSFFTPDPEVISIGAEFLKYIALTFGLVGAARVFYGGFRGAGQTLVAAAMVILTLGIIRYPCAILFSNYVGRTGVWWAFVTSNVFGIFIAFFWFRRGRWKERLIDEEDAEKGEVAEELSTLGETITE